MEQNYYLYEIFKSLVDALIPIAICCVLPIFFIRTQARRKMNESKDRTQIVLAAIEKNPDIDLEELLRKVTPTPRKKLLKQQLLTKLLVGSIISLVGFAGLCACILGTFAGGMPTEAATIFGGLSAIIMGIGIAFLVNYFIGKKMLAKEIEAEQKRLTETETEKD